MFKKTTTFLKRENRQIPAKCLKKVLFDRLTFTTRPSDDNIAHFEQDKKATGVGFNTQIEANEKLKIFLLSLYFFETVAHWEIVLQSCCSGVHWVLYFE